jgi:hypothetical protein
MPVLRTRRVRVRGRRNDDVKLDAPGADELLRYNADLRQRRGVVLILKSVEQVPHFGATRVELLVAVLVVAEELAAGGVKVEDAASAQGPSILRGLIAVTSRF